MHQPATRSWLRLALRVPLHRPRLTLLIAAVVAVAAAASASRVEPVASLTPLFDADDPASRAMIRVLDDFGAADQLLVLVQAPPTAQAPADGMTMFARRLRREVQADPALAGMITSLAYEPNDGVGDAVREAILPAGLYYLSDRQFDRLARRLQGEVIRTQVQRNASMIAVAGPEAEAVSERVLRDPLRLHEVMGEVMQPLQTRFAVGRSGTSPFIGRDGRSLLIQIRAAESAGDLAFTRALMAGMERAVARAEPGDLVVRFAGGYPIAELSERVIRRDMIFSVVCSVILLQLLFLLTYRSPWTFPLTFLPVAGGILAGFGVYAWLSTRLTPVTAASGAILAGLGIDYCIHYLSHYHTHRSAGHTPPSAARMSLSLAPALGAAWVTSLIGFGAIACSQVPALRDFAIIGTLGLAGAFLGAMLVLPAALQVCDCGGRDDRLTLRWNLTPVVYWVGRHTRTCLAFGGAALVAGVVWLMMAGLPAFESDMTVMQPRPSPPLETQSDIAKQFPGTLESVPVYLEADTWPELVAMSHEVDRRLMTPTMRAAGVASPLSVAMLLPDPATTAARQVRIESLDASRILADFRIAIDQSIFNPDVYADYEAFLEQLLRPSPPPGVAMLARMPEVAGMLLPRNLFSSEAAAAPQALTMVQFDHELASPGDRRAAIRRIETAVASVPGATVTGMDVVAEEVRSTIEAELPWLLSVAAAVVVGWLVIVFRRPQRVLLTMIPPVFCVVAVAVAMQVTGTRWNPVNLLALPLLMGIGVDDGIFLVSLASRHRERDGAMVEQLAASCHAITMTSMTTLLAFGSLWLASTPAIQSLGLVLTTGMIGCWVASLFILTPWLIAHHRRQARRGA